MNRFHLVFAFVVSFVPMLAVAKGSLPAALKSAMIDAELLPANMGFASESERFGTSIAVTGEIALIGAASSADGGFISNGDVLVFAFDAGAGEWNLETQLLPDDLVEGLAFGASISFDGARAVIGAPSADEPISNAGAAYVFRRDAPGVWVEESALLASDGGFGDSFGTSVAIDGDTIAIGTYLDDDGGSNAGAVYVFVDQGGGAWSEEDKLTGQTSQDQFGYAVALDQDVLAVGAPFADGGVAGSGAGYAYRRDVNGVWQSEGVLSAGAATGGNQQGLSIAVADGTIFVGAPYDDSIDSGAGAVHVFEEGVGSWTESTTLTVATSQSNDHMGIALAAADGKLVAGADGNDAVASNGGVAYVFSRPMGGSWTLEDTLTPAGLASQDSAGSAVALGSGVVLVGLPNADDFGSNTGAVAVFHNDAGSWLQQTRLDAGRGSVFDAFGTSVAIDGNFAVIGAPGDDTAADGAGAAYVFEDVAGTWQLVTSLLASDGAIGHAFGSVVDIHAGRAVVGAPGAVPGNVYVFEAASGWSETQRVGSPGDLFDFGYALALDGDRLVVSGISGGFGSVTVYDHDSANGWQESTRLEPDIPASSTRFADAVALHGDTVVVGARLDDEMDQDAGAAYVFQRTGSSAWTQAAQLSAEDGAAFHYFGTAVGIHGTTAVVGAPGTDFAGSNTGAVYVFEGGSGNWLQTQRVLAQDALPGEDLGTAITMEDGVFLASVPDANVAGNTVGAAIVFQQDPQGVWLESNRLQPVNGNDDDEFAASLGLSEGRWIAGVPGADQAGSNAGLALIGTLDTNAVPVAQDDELATDEDSPMTADLLADNGNGVDADADGEPVTIVEAEVDGQSYIVDDSGIDVALGSGGTLALSADGTVQFDPAGDYDALAANRQTSITFSYTIADPNTSEASADVIIVIAGINDDPEPVNDVATVTEDSGPVVLDVLDNDVDPDGGDTLIQSLTSPAFGSARLVQFGRAVEYTPDPNACTTDVPDSFDYRFANGAAGTISVNIGCVDDAPQAVADSFDVVEDLPAVLNVLNNDTDVDSGPLMIESFTDPANGQVSLEGGGLLYTPDNDYCSDTVADAFSYAVNGGSQATVSVFVQCVDDPGIAVGDAFQILEDSAPMLDVLANDVDADGGAVVDSVSPAMHGFVAVEGGLLTYVPEADYCGTDSWHYTLDGGSVAEVTVDVSCVNDPPRIQPNDVFEPSGSSGPRAINILDGLRLGGQDEASQMLIHQSAAETFDFDNVVESVALGNGVLEFELTGNDGSADIAIVLQDDGGVASGGMDTSQTIVRIFVSEDVVPDLAGTASGPSVVFAGSAFHAQVTVSNEGLQPALADIAVALDNEIAVNQLTCRTMAETPCSGAKNSGWVVPLAPSEFVTLDVDGTVAEQLTASTLISEVILADLGGNETSVDNNVVRMETTVGLFVDGFE